MFGLPPSHTALALAASKKTVAGTIVRIVSSNKRVKSKFLSGPAYAGPNWESELLLRGSAMVSSGGSQDWKKRGHLVKDALFQPYQWELKRCCLGKASLR